MSSEPVCSLTWAEEVFYRRLLNVVDDYGRFHAMPKLLRASLYPLQIDKVSDQDVDKWLTSCVRAGLVRVYPAEDGKRYVEVDKFGQQLRTKSKFPAFVNNGEQLKTSDNNCYQLQTDVHLGVSVSVDELETTSLVGAPTREPVPFEKVRELWREVCKSLPDMKPVAEWGASRKTAFRSRWNDRQKLGKYTNVDEGLTYWRRVFERIEASDFLCGRGDQKAGRTTFVADFDWVVKEANFLKILEGKYVNR